MCLRDSRIFMEEPQYCWNIRLSCVLAIGRRTSLCDGQIPCFVVFIRLKTNALAAQSRFSGYVNIIRRCELSCYPYAVNSRGPSCICFICENNRC